MLRSYLTIALRNLRRHKVYTFINVAGLAVGMGVCLLIGLYVSDELTFDRFHEDADRLVVLGNESNWGRSLSTPYPLATTLQEELPEVEAAVRLTYGGDTPVVREATRLRSTRNVLAADAAFFELFTFPLVAGDPATVLAAPDAAVLTESTARAYFGEEDPVGQTLTFERYGTRHTVTVRGIARDVPVHSTIRFDMVVPLEVLPEDTRRADGWGAHMYRTFARLQAPVAADRFADRVNDAVRPHHRPEDPPGFFALPLTSLYLSNLQQAQGFTGQARYVYLFGSIALFVLLIAAINYVNLVTAQAGRRAREVGVRKTLGAGRLQLVRQFLSESVLLSSAALLLALLGVEVALPAFNHLFDKALSLRLWDHRQVLLGLSAFVLAVGVAAGAYPAFILARFQPVRVLRGAGTTRTGGPHLLRQGLVVVQFAITAILLVGTAVIYRQLDYMQHKNLGFDGEQVVSIELPGQRAWQMRDVLRQDAEAHAGILHATVTGGAPGAFYIQLGFPPASLSPQAQTEAEQINIIPAVVDYDFAATLGLQLQAGRFFSRAHASDATRAYVLNERTAAALGWTPQEAVGKPFQLGRAAPAGEVVGVVADFHIASLREALEPVVLQLREDPSWSAPGLLLAKLAPDQMPEAMRHLEALLARLAPDDPFQYTFLDDTFDAMYRTEQRLGQVLSTFAVLAIFIACLGLFGLAAYTAEARTKEVGIRKVLGATVPQIVALLSREFVRLVLLAFLIAAPVAYLLMQRWLEDFAYRVALSWTTFLLAGLTALGVALLTVSYQALRAAVSDPVKALRYE